MIITAIAMSTRRFMLTKSSKNEDAADGLLLPGLNVFIEYPCFK